MLRTFYAVADLRKGAAGDLDAEFHEYADPDFELRVPASYPDLEGARGLDALHAMTQALGEVWEEWRYETETYFEGGNRIVVFVRLLARGKGSGVPIELPGAHVWTFQSGKVLSMDVHFDRTAALEEAGLSGTAPQRFAADG